MTTPPLAAPDLWTSARAMLTELFYTIGQATAAQLARLKRRERTHAIEWLAALELMVRKVLLIEAAAMCLDHWRPRRHGSAAPKNAGEAPAVPSKHAPAFQLTAQQTPEPHHPARIRDVGAPITITEILQNAVRAKRIQALRNAPRAAPHARLVNRINALARVIADPRFAIRRLARTLRKQKRIAFAIAAARVKIPFTFPGDAYRLSEERALASALHLPNSS